MSLRPTIKDIAKLSQSSIATVSRVLNNTDYPVSKDLRERILKIARELDYKPNIYGKALKGGSTREIGLLIPNISNPFYSELVSGVERVCIKKDYTPIICSSYNDKSLEKKHLNMLINKQVDGILPSFIGHIGKNIDQIETNKMPFVLFDQIYKKNDIYSVSYDFEKAGYLAAEFLLSQGIRSIVFLTAPFDRESRKSIFKGFKNAYKKYDLKFDNKNLIIANQPEHEIDTNVEMQNGINLTKLMLNKIGLPEAIVAINDITALGVLQKLYSKNIKVPEKVSVISFDDIPLADMVTPKLTTIRQPAHEIGKKAADMLIDIIEGKNCKEKTIIIKPQLMIRNSVRLKENNND